MVRGHKRSIGAPLPQLPPTEALILEAMAATMAGPEWADLHRPGEALLARWLSGNSLSALEAASARASNDSASIPSMQGAQLVSGKRGDSWRARYSFQGKTRTITGLASQAEAAAVRDAAFLLLHPVEDHRSSNNVSRDNKSRCFDDSLSIDPNAIDDCDAVSDIDAGHPKDKAHGAGAPALHSPAAILGILNSAHNPFAPCFPLRLADFLVAVLKSCQGGSRSRQCAPSISPSNPYNPLTATAQSFESSALNDSSMAEAQACKPSSAGTLTAAPLTNAAAATTPSAATYFESPTSLRNPNDGQASSKNSAAPLHGVYRGAAQASSSSLANLVPRGSLPPSKRPLQYQAGVTHREWLALVNPAQAPLHLFRTSGLSAACRDLGLPCRPAQDSSMARRDVERRIRSRLAQIAASNAHPSTEMTGATSFASGNATTLAPAYPDVSYASLENQEGTAAVEPADIKNDILPVPALRLGNEAIVDRRAAVDEHPSYYGYGHLDSNKGTSAAGETTAAMEATVAVTDSSVSHPKSRRERHTSPRPSAKRRKGISKLRPENSAFDSAAQKEDAATAASLAADEADLLLQAEENLAAESLANMAAHGPSQGGMSSSSSSGSSYGNSSNGLISHDSHSYSSLSTGPSSSIVGAGTAGTLAESAGDEVTASSSGYGFGAFDSLVTGAFLGFLFQVDGVHDHGHSDDEHHRGGGDERGNDGNDDDDGQDAPYFINEPYDLAEGPWPGSSRL